MRIVNVFLSLGFEGRSKDEVMDKIQKMKNWLNKDKSEDVEYHFFHNHDCKKPDWVEFKYDSVYYLSHALKTLSTCDLILIAYDDIKTHNGVYLEFCVSNRCDIPIMFYNENNYTVFV